MQHNYFPVKAIKQFHVILYISRRLVKMVVMQILRSVSQRPFCIGYWAFPIPVNYFINGYATHDVEVGVQDLHNRGSKARG